MYKLYKRGKIYHYAVYLNGKQYRGSTKADNKDLATICARKIYEDIYKGKFGLVKQGANCDEFLTSYLSTQASNVCDEWAYTARLFLEKFLRFLKSKDIESIEDVTTQHVEDYKAMLLKQMTPVSAKNNVGVISAMFNRAVKLKIITHNPVHSVTPIRGIEKNKQRYLTKEEIESVLNATQGTNIAGLVLVALHTGMRRGELIHLEYSDIDLQNKLIYVRNKASLGFQTKSRKERTIPIHEKIHPILSKRKEGYCFVGHDGKSRKSPRTTSEAFTAIAEGLGMFDVGLHTLRHTFASHLAMAGVSLWEIAKLLGHSSTHVTELYSHLCPSRREIEKLNF